MKAHHILRKIFAAALAFIVLCMFSGCLSSGVQELYSLPEPSEGYLALQKKINSVPKSPNLLLVVQRQAPFVFLIQKMPPILLLLYLSN